jgi:hypothetical protein
MENYKKEMFEYLSKPENYASAKEVAKLLPDLENHHTIIFWID